MSGKKRNSNSAAAGPRAKQQKVAAMKEEKMEEKRERAPGWLQDFLQQQRAEGKEIKLNKKRIRVISDTEKIKQGSEGVLYWMSRDHRVQGKSL